MFEKQYNGLSPELEEDETKESEKDEEDGRDGRVVWGRALFLKFA